ncbi:MAG: bifunctional biotin--[acetyl-CoA-carboxylase] ligase/biotin operon repressor BirA [Pseudomonadales bacterium]
MNLDELLAILADGKFHSGEDLSRVLDVSRTTVWKQVAKLQNLGVEVNAVKGRGYRLRGAVDLLSLAEIYRHLSDRASDVFDHIDLKLTVESTNRMAGDSNLAPYVCLAEMQTAGRGRRGREWVSPFATNIYLSLVWRFNEATASLDSLSLCVAVAMARALRRLGCSEVGLKWPNDLLFEGRKLAGILLEASGEIGGPIRVVIGIGLNVAMTEGQAGAIDQDWISLNEISSKSLSRNEIVAAVLDEMAVALPVFEDEGFVAFESDWREFDCLINKSVDLHLGSGVIAGVARGVGSTGELFIEHGDTIKSYRGGEVSVRVSK